MTNKLKIEENMFHFWLDELEVYGTFKDELFISSNDVKIINWYFIKRYSVDKYQYKIVFYRDEEDLKTSKNILFSYYKWNKNQTIPTKDYIIVHWTCFRIITEDRILFFLDQFNLTKTKRFDIACDITIDIETILNNFSELKQIWATFNGKLGKISTRYIWEKQKTKNKRQLIRIYDKLLEIKDKKKNHLYADYLLNNYMTRTELEVRSELAKNIYFIDLFNSKILFRIFKNYTRKHTELFNEFEGKKLTLYSKKVEQIDPELYQSTYYRDKRRNIFLWHAKLVFNLWYCPIRVLIEEWYIKELTKKAIWIDNINDLAEKEKIVKELAKEEKYERKNLEEILANYYKYGG